MNSKTAGIPETASTSVVGVAESHVDTANTAAIVNGDNGNKYIKNTTVNLTVEQHIHLVSHKVPGLRRVNSRVRRDSGGNTSLQVEFTKSPAQTERRQFENEVATEREARTEVAQQKGLGVEYPDDTQNIGINIRDDYFSAPELLGVDMRIPVATKGNEVSTCLCDDDTEEEEDFVFVDLPPAEGSMENKEADSAGGNTEGRARVKYFEGEADETDVLKSDSADISLRQIVKDGVDGIYLAEDVVPSDTGWRVGDSMQSTSVVTDPQDVNALRLEEDPDSYQTEHALGRKQPSISQRSQNTNKRRNSIDKIAEDLQRIKCFFQRQIIEHLLQDIVFVLRDNPMKVNELSEKVNDIMYNTKRQDDTRVSSGTRKSDTLNRDTVFAEELTDELWAIESEHVRHEARQLIESVLCLGVYGSCELRGLANFVKGLKLALICH